MSAWGSKRKSTKPTKPLVSTLEKETGDVFAVVGPGLERVEYLDYKPRTFKVDGKKIPVSRKKTYARSVPVAIFTSLHTRGSTTNGRSKDSGKKPSSVSSWSLTSIGKKTAKPNIFTGSRNYLSNPRFSASDAIIVLVLILLFRYLAEHLVINWR